MKVPKFARTFPRILAIVFLFATSVLTPTAQAQVLFDSNATDAYNFPTRPGTEDWKAFTDHQQMLDACRIPDLALKNMSTKGLVKSVLDYPLLGDMGAYNSMQQGLEAVTGQFNGLAELFRRSDAGAELLSVYQSLNPNNVDNKNWTSIQKGAYAVGIAEVETMLSQDSVLSKLNESQLQIVLSQAREKFAAKKDSPVFWQGDFKTTATLIDQISERQYSPKWSYGQVWTPMNTSVSVILDSDEMSPEDIAYWDNWAATVYPDATQLYSSTNLYNCHSFAWYWQNAVLNNAWMNDPSAYWTDGSYSRVSPTSYIQYSRLVYANSSNQTIHSAYVVSGSGSNYLYWTVQSKWGATPLMQHAAWYSPYYSTTYYYYQYN